MTRARYTLLGWVVWHVAKFVAKRKARQQGPKVAAAVVIVGIIVAGIQAARAERGS